MTTSPIRQETINGIETYTDIDTFGLNVIAEPRTLPEYPPHNLTGKVSEEFILFGLILSAKRSGKYFGVTQEGYKDLLEKLGRENNQAWIDFGEAHLRRSPEKLEDLVRVGLLKKKTHEGKAVYFPTRYLIEKVMGR